MNILFTFACLLVSSVALPREYFNITYVDLRIAFQNSTCGQNCGASKTYDRCCVLNVNHFNYAAGYLQDQVSEYCCSQDDSCQIPLTTCGLCEDPLLKYGVEQCMPPPPEPSTAGVVLPVQTGLTAHHSWSSFQDDNTWEDLTGNGHHATRQGSGSGTVSLVSAADANTTGFGGLGPWPYISGDENSRWDLFAGQTLNSSFTIVYIMRYDVNASERARIIDMEGHNYFIGAAESNIGKSYGNIGKSYHEGWITYSPTMQNTEWVLGIEMHGRQVRRGTVTTQWADNTGGQHAQWFLNQILGYAPNHDSKLVATINNGYWQRRGGSPTGSHYNIAEIIYYNREFTESEINDMKDWLDDYAAGMVHDNYGN